MRPTWFLAGVMLLSACKKTPAAAGDPGATRSDPTTALIDCRKGDAKRPDNEVPAKAVTLSLSLEAFGPFPTADGGLETWGASPAPITSQCRPIGTSEPLPRVGFYKGGGFVQTFCTYEIGKSHVTNDAELAAALRPIDSPRKALAMVALGKVLAYEPDVSAKAPTTQVKMPTSLLSNGVPRAFEVEAHSNGYLVRVPVDLNCPRMVLRVAYRVTTAGEVCEADESPIVLDVGSGVCVD